jgi:predicted ATPase
VKKRPGARSDTGFLLSVTLLRERVASFDQYPFSIPAIRALDTLRFDPHVTFLIGENGSRKSTLIEAVAMLAGFNPEGGSKNFSFASRPGESELQSVGNTNAPYRRAPLSERRAEPHVQSAV